MIFICSLQKGKYCQICIFFRREFKIKYLSLSVSRIVFYFTFSTTSKFLPPIIISFSKLKEMTLCTVDPSRIFTPIQLNYSFLHCFSILFQNRRKQYHLEAIYIKPNFNLQKNLKWPDIVVFYRLHTRCFPFYRLPKTSISYCISAPLCPMIIYNEQNYKTL